VHRVQVLEARAAGADTLLLIVAILPDSELSEFIDLSRSLGMEPLVEAANEAEMHAAVQAGARVIGVNNRDLRSFKVDLGTTARLIACIRSSQTEPLVEPVFVLSLSGIRAGRDVATVAVGCQPSAAQGTQGIHLAGILVGEALMKMHDPAQLVAELREAFKVGPSADSQARECTGLVKVCGITNTDDAMHAARSGAQLIGMIRVPGSKRCCSPGTARGIVGALKAYREQDPSPDLAKGLAVASSLCAGGDGSASREQLAASSDVQVACTWFHAFWVHGLQAAAQRAPPLTVGVYQDMPMAEVAADAQACGFDLVQLHGDETVQSMLQLPPSLPVIRVVHLPPAAEGGSDAQSAYEQVLTQAVPGAAAVLLVDARRPGQQGGGTGAAVDWSALGGMQALAAKAAPAAPRLPFVVAGGIDASSVQRAILESAATGVDVSSGVEGGGSAGPTPRKDPAAVQAYIQAARKTFAEVATAASACQEAATGAAAGAAAASPPTS